MGVVSALDIFVFVAIASWFAVLTAIVIRRPIKLGQAFTNRRLETRLRLAATFVSSLGFLVLYLGNRGILPFPFTLITLLAVTGILVLLFWIAHKKFPTDRGSDFTEPGRG